MYGLFAEKKPDKPAFLGHIWPCLLYTSLPTSIYQIEGAERCAIEFCSFSKTAGFTGMRCGYTVIPQGLVCDGTPLNELWLRRQTTKFNGVSYITQRSAEAALSPEGLEQIRQNIDYYLFNAGQIVQTLRELGIWFMGGENSPYIWLKCPQSMTSWAFFDHLLTKLALVGTPGTGFGAGGEGFFRLTGFGSRENTLEAMERSVSYTHLRQIHPAGLLRPLRHPEEYLHHAGGACRCLYLRGVL